VDARFEVVGMAALAYGAWPSTHQQEKTHHGPRL